MIQLGDLSIITSNIFIITHFHFLQWKYFPSVLYYHHPEFLMMLILNTSSILVSGNLVNRLLGKDLYLIKKKKKNYYSWKNKTLFPYPSFIWPIFSFTDTDKYSAMLINDGSMWYSYMLSTKIYRELFKNACMWNNRLMSYFKHQLVSSSTTPINS